MQTGEIILYQPDNSVHLDRRTDERPWGRFPNNATFVFHIPKIFSEIFAENLNILLFSHKHNIWGNRLIEHYFHELTYITANTKF